MADGGRPWWRDEWRGDVRHVHKIAELRDVSVVSHPYLPSIDSRAALRTYEGNEMDEVTNTPEERSDERRSRQPEENRLPAGTLRVEERAQFREASSR